MCLPDFLDLMALTRAEMIKILVEGPEVNPLLDHRG
jgi:hypothetical protein